MLPDSLHRTIGNNGNNGNISNDLRNKCQATIADLTGEKAHQQITFGWMKNHPISFLELLLYSMRHVQEHGAQLNMFLRQNAVDEITDWVPRAKANEIS